MKLYESKYRYSKLDHTEYKNLMYQLVIALRDYNYIEISSNNKYVVTNNNKEYCIYLIPLCISKKTILLEMELTDQIHCTTIKVKQLKIKLGLYYYDNLWKLWWY